MTEERWDLPQGWGWAKVSEVAKIVGGGTPPSKTENNFAINGIPWITPSDLSGYDAPYISKGRRDLSPKGYQNSGARLIPKGSVLFSSRAPIGYCVIADTDLCTSQGFKSLVLPKELLPEFVRYYLLASKDYAESLARGTTFLELSSSRFGAMQIPVAPVPEQRRIINELDGILNRVAVARSEILNVNVLLKQFKNQILQSAYDGRLIKGIAGSHSLLGQVSENLAYGTSRKSHENVEGTPVLRIPNIVSGKIELNHLKYSNFDEIEYEKLRLKVGDLLVVRSNGSPALVGLSAVVAKEAANMAYAGYLIRIRPNFSVINPHYLSYMLQAPKLRAQIESQVTSTSGVHNVNAKQLAALPIPTPSVEQQVQVVERLDKLFAWIVTADGEATASLNMLDKLQSSLLLTRFKAKDDAIVSNTAAHAELLESLKTVDPPTLPEPMLRDRETVMTDDPKHLLIKDSHKWPKDGLAFEELAKRVPMDHDQMRDTLFELLTGKSPEFIQSFDSTAGRILIKRGSK